MKTMKRITSQKSSWIFPLWIIVCLSFCFGCSALQVEPNIAVEFHGVAWGQSHNNIEDFQVIPEEFVGENSRYLRGYRKNEEMRFADADVNTIEYHFKDDQFYMAYIVGSGSQNFDRMLAFLHNTYMEPRLKREDRGTYIWIISDIAIQLRYYYMESRFIVHVYYMPLK